MRFIQRNLIFIYFHDIGRFPKFFHKFVCIFASFQSKWIRITVIFGFQMKNLQLI